MINLNDTMYDDVPYSTRSYNKNDLSYIISDQKLIDKLQSYQLFESELVKNIMNKVSCVYLRFCDGEYIYYTKKDIMHYVNKAIKKILMREEKTSWGELMNNNLQSQHYSFFENSSNIIKFCPMFSDSWIYSLKKSHLYEIVLRQKSIGHLYYVYHFLNCLRQNKISELIGIKIAYVTHNNYIEYYDHYKIGVSYNEESIQMLETTDFSTYDLVLLGGGISSPLYSKAILKSCKCPIIDSGYMLSIWDSKSQYNEGPYTHLIY